MEILKFIKIIKYENKVLKKLKSEIKTMSIKEWNYEESSSCDMKGTFDKEYSFEYKKDNLWIKVFKDAKEECITPGLYNKRYSIILKKDEDSHIFSGKGKNIYNFLQKQKKKFEKEELKQEKYLQRMKEKIKIDNEITNSIKNLKSLETSLV